MICSEKVAEKAREEVTVLKKETTQKKVKK